MTDKLFMDVKDVTKILEVSDGKAYEIIRMLNEELKQQGYMVVQGKVNTKYFFQKTSVLGLRRIYGSIQR